ncbi:MAG TPA: hypothetical protein VHD61_15585 [Lacunisphaera sp.]|nr:hypothetical protein [Lacunisphaera sp.]
MTMHESEDIAMKGKAVSIRAAIKQGSAEFYDDATPLDALIAAEESDDEQDGDGGAIPAVMTYLFSESPHPANVVLRTYQLAEEIAPYLLRTLPTVELQQLTAESAHEWRIKAILRGTAIARRPAWRHDVVINDTLAAAFHKWRAHPHRAAGQPSHPIKLAALLRVRRGETAAAYRTRIRAMEALLQFFFFDGSEPENTSVRVFCLAKFSYSNLLHDLTVRQLGTIFGVKGATWSERIKQKVNRFLADRGAVGVMARFQKSAEACEAYARSQLGNRNRRGERRTA